MTEVAAGIQARRWLVGSAARTEPLRLYCFAHGGGTVAGFLRWQLPGVEVWGVQLPGRGSRLDEPAPEDMASLAAELAEQVRFGTPYAFFGHSFGALLAFEVTRSLRRAGRTLPVRLFASGYPAPDLPLTQEPIHQLPDADFLAAISRRYDAVPPEVLQNADLAAAVLPALRMDYRLLETHRHRAESPLPVPITALAGSDDLIGGEELRGWGRQCEFPVSVCLIPGGHFYLQAKQDRLLRTISAQLRPAVAGSARSC
ncbi:MAG TPA: alpha/beta fold hydrolase [Jatrophihabitans sp.]|nr:alpha/beta fold hydrolase [Jatrophihabitans sp.]